MPITVTRPRPRLLTVLVATTLIALATLGQGDKPQVRHATIGDKVTSSDGSVTVTCIDKKQSYNGGDSKTFDDNIYSPKSVTFHPDGSRYYVNSLEGGATVVYDVKTGKRLKVISHRHDSGEGALWSEPCSYYRFTHYTDGQKRSFMGKPVESAFSHHGRYLWVPYYRRSFDINAQDPSAVAIIDTRSDSIVRMMDTGPLPKMICCSNDGRLMAVTHWGNNTVGLIDISSNDPRQWHHLAPVAVGKELQLDFSLTQAVDRDRVSGVKLRGTAFTPDDRYLLVSCMGGSGIAVIDVAQRTWLGLIGDINNARHLVIRGGYLYASLNVAGQVKRIPLDSITAAIPRRQGTSIRARGWETCQVGRGARTIELSPSGNFLFAACNFSSELDVVDTRTMRVIARMTVDSYPVGLDISDDGSMVITTSQGRKDHGGGNAVDVFSVTYADPEAERQAYTASINTSPTEEQDSTDVSQQPANGQPLSGFTWRPWMNYAAIVAGIALIVLVAWFRSRRDS